MAEKAHEIRLKSRPVGMPKPENFELAEVTLPEPKDGEVLVRNMWMSVDPYMRGRMYDRPSYVPPFRIGEALPAVPLGTFHRMPHPLLRGTRIRAASTAAIDSPCVSITGRSPPGRVSCGNFRGGIPR